MNAYANNSFNKSPANMAKIAILTFLGVQGIRQLIQVNEQAGRDKNPIESQAGKVAAWMTITMTLLAGFLLYQPKMATFTALGALFIAALASGSAMIYDYMDAKSTQTVEVKRNRLFFGIAHIIFALLTLVYLLISLM
jgi:uncharacterized membrane protein HdeD (DUF308 family)